MKMTTIELRKITASEGMVLTNGEVYSKEVYLGCNDSPDNWYEITEDKWAALTANEEDQNPL